LHFPLWQSAGPPQGAPFAPDSQVPFTQMLLVQSVMSLHGDPFEPFVHVLLTQMLLVQSVTSLQGEPFPPFVHVLLTQMLLVQSVTSLQGEPLDPSVQTLLTQMLLVQSVRSLQGEPLDPSVQTLLTQMLVEQSAGELHGPPPDEVLELLPADDEDEADDADDPDEVDDPDDVDEADADVLELPDVPEVEDAAELDEAVEDAPAPLLDVEAAPVPVALPNVSDPWVHAATVAASAAAVVSAAPVLSAAAALSAAAVLTEALIRRSDPREVMLEGSPDSPCRASRRPSGPRRTAVKRGARRRRLGLPCASMKKRALSILAVVLGASSAAFAQTADTATAPPTPSGAWNLRNSDRVFLISSQAEVMPRLSLRFGTVDGVQSVSAGPGNGWGTASGFSGYATDYFAEFSATSWLQLGAEINYGTLGDPATVKLFAPAGYVKAQFLRQEEHGVNMAVALNGKKIGFSRATDAYPNGGELEGQILIDRHWGIFTLAFNGVFGKSFTAPDSDTEAKLSAGWRVRDNLLLGLDTITRVDTSFDGGPHDGTRYVEFDGGGMITWKVWNIGLSGLGGIAAPMHTPVGYSGVGPMGMIQAVYTPW
jgi:hypothetical protein